jgi:hypothetical protein
VKFYQKLALITAILGLVLLVPIVVGFVYINSLIGIPILGLFVGGAMLHVLLLLVVNLAALYIVFRVKNMKTSGILLIVCGVIILATTTYLGVPAFVLFSIAGIIAIREKTPVTNLTQKNS